MPFASCAISVSNVTVGTKMEAFSRIGTKSGKNKIQGLKQKSPENVGTKSGFFLFFFWGESGLGLDLEDCCNLPDQIGLGWIVSDLAQPICDGRKKANP